MENYIQKKTSGGIVLVSEDSELLEKGIIQITESITEKTVMKFFSDIMLLKERDENKKIMVLINSPGGEVDSAFAICDMIEDSGDIITVCIGKAFSAGALILSSGKRRICLPHSRVMIHRPHFHGSIDGNYDSLTAAGELLAKHNESICRYLSQKCKKSFEEITSTVTNDYYMDANDAKEFGIVDDVLTFDKLRKELL